MTLLTIPELNHSISEADNTVWMLRHSHGRMCNEAALTVEQFDSLIKHVASSGAYNYALRNIPGMTNITK